MHVQTLCEQIARALAAQGITDIPSDGELLTQRVRTVIVIDESGKRTVYGEPEPEVARDSGTPGTDDLDPAN